METSVNASEENMIKETIPDPSAFKGATSTEKTQTQGSDVATEQLIVTRRADNGEIISIETIDSSGVRGDVSEDKCLQIVGEDEIAEIDAALDAAYDAAFVEALQTSDELEGDDAEDDRVLERLITFKLLGRRMGRELDAVRRTLLRRLVLRRLVRRHVLRNRTQGSNA